MAKRRQPLQGGVEGFRDLVGSETATKPRTNPESAIRKPLRQTRNGFEQVFDPNAHLIIEFGNASKFKQEGPTRGEIRKLMWEYENRTPQERLELLAAIEMLPREVAKLFNTESDIPDLPESDPVFIYSGRSGLNEKRRIENACSITLDRIVTRSPHLWTRVVTCFASVGLTTLGDVRDTDPDELEIKNYGTALKTLTGEILRSYGLLTPVWTEYLLKKTQKS